MALKSNEKFNFFYSFVDPELYPELSPIEDPQMAVPVLTEVTMSPRSAYRKESGETFKLVCEALGEPDPEVKWFKDNVSPGQLNIYYKN